MQPLGDMRIDIQGDRHVGVPESFLNDLRVLASSERERCPGVTQIVQPDRRKSCTRGLDSERPREPFRVERGAIGSAEHQAVIGETGAHQQPLGKLPLAMLP